jgi:hypothetical protein
MKLLEAAMQIDKIIRQAIDEERMLSANQAIVYYQSFDSHYCPEYPGF